MRMQIAANFPVWISKVASKRAFDCVKVVFRFTRTFVPTAVTLVASHEAGSFCG